MSDKEKKPKTKHQLAMTKAREWRKPFLDMCKQGRIPRELYDVVQSHELVYESMMRSYVGIVTAMKVGDYNLARSALDEMESHSTQIAEEVKRVRMDLRRHETVSWIKDVSDAPADSDLCPGCGEPDCPSKNIVKAAKTLFDSAGMAN